MEFLHKDSSQTCKPSPVFFELHNFSIFKLKINIVGIFNKFIIRLKHLDLYSGLRKVFGAGIHQKSSLQKENRVWASRVAVEQQEAVKNLFKTRAEKFSEKYPQEFQSAMEIQKKSSEKEEFVASDLLYAACEFTQSKNVMEIGAGSGWSSLVCWKSLAKKNGTLYSANRPDTDRIIEKK